MLPVKIGMAASISPATPCLYLQIGYLQPSSSWDSGGGPEWPGIRKLWPALTVSKGSTTLLRSRSTWRGFSWLGCSVPSVWGGQIGEVWSTECPRSKRTSTTRRQDHRNLPWRSPYGTPGKCESTLFILFSKLLAEHQPQIQRRMYQFWWLTSSSSSSPPSLALTLSINSSVASPRRPLIL